MKQTELIVLGLAGVAVYLIWQSQKKPTGTTGTTSGSGSKPADWVSEILGTDGKRYDNGWRYFSDGTAIDPAGNYYKDGAMIWQKPGGGLWL